MVTAVCPTAGVIIAAISKAFLFGQLIGGGIAAGLTALQGGSFRQIAESYFDGAFLGGFGALTACALMTPLVSLPFGGAVAIGGVSAGLPQTLSYYGDRFFKGEEISDKEIIIGSALAALHGAIFAAIFYVMSNGISFKGRGGDTAKGHEDVLDDVLKDGTGSVDDGLKGGKTPTFRAGVLYEDSIVVDNHTIETLAEVEIDGDRLILKDIVIYSTEGDIPNEIGFSKFKSWLNVIKELAKDQGFNQLQIIGQRAQHSTSANPGSIINFIFDLK